MHYGLIYLAVLAVLAGLSGWFLVTVEASLQARHGADNDTPRVIIHRFRAQRMTAQGLRQYTISAPYLEELSGDGGTRIRQPVMDIYQDGRQRSWSLRSQQAWMAADRSVIRLEDGVDVRRQADNRHRHLHLSTRQLLFHPDTAYLETQQPVRLETPGGVVTATGAKAWLESERVELLADVRGTYASSHDTSTASDTASPGPIRVPSE